MFKVSNKGTSTTPLTDFGVFHIVLVSLLLAVVNFKLLSYFHPNITRSSHRRCSVRKDVFLEISQISQENTCVRVSFLIKLQAAACNFIKKETLAQVFSCEFCEISKNTFFTEHLRWLLLLYYKEIKWCTTTGPCQTFMMECCCEKS